jgi:hypothetical protein
LAEFFAHVFRDAGAAAKGAVEQALKETIGGTAVQTDAILQGGTTPIKFVRCWADGDCYIAWGADPTATTDSIPIGAGHGPEYFEIPAGYKISVIEKV